MCGRYFANGTQLAEDVQALLGKANRKPLDLLAIEGWKHDEVFPTDKALVLLQKQGEIAPAVMRWGYPKWDNKGTIINARSESVQDKPMFASALSKRRLVVPTNGFYEWKHVGGKSIAGEKNLFLSPGRETLYLAGIYDEFTDSKTGQKEWMYVVLTTQANESVASYHDRMPVLLEEDDVLPWLLDDIRAQALLRRPQVPLSAQEIGNKQMNLFDELF